MYAKKIRSISNVQLAKVTSSVNLRRAILIYGILRNQGIMLAKEKE